MAGIPKRKRNTRSSAQHQTGHTSYQWTDVEKCRWLQNEFGYDPGKQPAPHDSQTRSEYEILEEYLRLLKSGVVPIHRLEIR